MDWFRTILFWFALTSVLGFFIFFSYPGFLPEILKTLTERFGDQPQLNIDLALQIFVQNVTASGIAMLGGLIFGLGAILVVVVNGLLIGYVISAVFSVQENFLYSLAFLFGGLVPHGILELPAFFLAAALGLRLGLEWTFKEAEGKRLRVVKSNLIRAIKAIPAIIVLLFVAAMIEVFVTGWIVDKF